MPTPTHKTQKIEDSLTKAFGFDRREYIRELKCVPAPIGCAKLISIHDYTEQYTEIEKKEYEISGLCRECQKEVFSGIDE
jgi:hypothetical protein